MDAPQRCIRCRAELPKDSSYCVGCGFQNVDLVAKSATAVFAREQQIEKLKQRVALQKTLRKWFWFLR